MRNAHKISEIARYLQFVRLTLVVSLLSCIRGASHKTHPAHPKNSGVMILTLYYSRNSICESSISIIPGFISQKMELEGDSATYKVKIYDQLGKVLHAVTEFPSIICYDYLSETGELRGGVENAAEKDWVLRLPVFPNMAKIEITSPRDEVVFLRNFKPGEIEKLR